MNKTKKAALSSKIIAFGVIATASALIGTASTAKADVERGKTLFAERCSSCHGPQGAGDGPVAAALPPEMKPRNLQEAKFKVTTDDASMVNLLKQGGAALGLNPLMPQQPDLKDDDLKSIVEFVRTLKK